MFDAGFLVSRRKKLSRWEAHSVQSKPVGWHLVKLEMQVEYIPKYNAGNSGSFQVR